jgi:hypothetical protein
LIYFDFIPVFLIEFSFFFEKFDNQIKTLISEKTIKTDDNYSCHPVIIIISTGSRNNHNWMRGTPKVLSVSISMTIRKNFVPGMHLIMRA